MGQWDSQRWTAPPLLQSCLLCLVCLRGNFVAAGPAQRVLLPRTLAQGRAVLLPLLSADISNSSAVVQQELQRHSLRRRLKGGARMWLYGHVLTEGYYYTMLGLGTPAQQFALIVDTGSTVTYVPCQTCTHCGRQHQDTPYIASSSTTYKAVQCDSSQCPGRQCGPDQVCAYSRHYAEDSTSSGIIASDVASFGSVSTIAPTRILFGCETSETGDLYTQRADGIIGMGKGSLGIMNQLVSAGSTEDQFSLCYGGMERGGGSMIVGGITPPPAMDFVPLDSRPGEGTYYNVAVEGVMVDGKKLNVPSSIFNDGYGSVLDSGTTFTYLPGAAFRAIKQAVTDAVLPKGMNKVDGPDPHYEDVCFGPASQDPSELSQYFPIITLVFRPNVSYQLHPENFLFRHTSDRTAYCLGVFENKDRGTLLGGILVRNTMVMYDRSGARVGFWKTNCSDLFETLTALEGQQAPPLPPQLADEPPSDVPPSTDTDSQSKPQTLPPLDTPTPTAMPPPASGSVCDGCAAKLEVALRVSVSSSSFAPLQEVFSADLARELSIEKDEISDVSYADDSNGSGGSTDVSATVVHFTILPASGDSVLSNATVKRIQGILQNADFSLRDEFGSVTLASFVLISPQPAKPWSPYWLYIVAAMALCTIIVAAAILWRRRPRSALSAAVEEERREESAALAGSGPGYQDPVHQQEGVGDLDVEAQSMQGRGKAAEELGSKEERRNGEEAGEMQHQQQQ